MIPSLFPDQQASIDKLRDELRRHKRVLLQGETGSGKSVMAAYMIASSRVKGLKSAFVVPRRDLLHQMSTTFNEFEISHSYVSDKKQFNPFSMTHICTTGSLISRKHLIKPNIIFFDECHFGSNQLADLNAYYSAQGAWVIGLSATPERPGGKGMKEFYDSMVTGPTIRQLIDLRRLSDYRLFAPSKPDLSKIKTVAGDYMKSELAQFMENQTYLIGDAVKHYKQFAMGKLNITFCTSIKHSEMTAEAFRAAGVPTMHMDGETPEDVRRKIAQSFARRELLNICSVDLMTFGYDLAAASGMKTAVIESMSDLRPTKSRPLQRQKNGRVLRYKPEPGIILDHAGNAMEHGMPCEVVKWHLDGKEKNKAGSSGGAVAVKQCDHCYFVHAPALRCPNCGREYEIDSRMVKTVDGELVELDPNQAKFDRARQQKQAKTFDDLVALGKQRGVKNPAGWAKHVLAGRQAKNGR